MQCADLAAELSEFSTMLDEVLESRASMLLRMRLQCRVVRTDDGEAVHSVENESDSEAYPCSLMFVRQDR